MNNALQIIFGCYEFITELLSLDINSKNKIANSLKDLLYEILKKCIFEYDIYNESQIYNLLNKDLKSNCSNLSKIIKNINKIN